MPESALDDFFATLNLFHAFLSCHIDFFFKMNMYRVVDTEMLFYV